MLDHSCVLGGDCVAIVLIFPEKFNVAHHICKVLSPVLTYQVNDIMQVWLASLFFLDMFECEVECSKPDVLHFILFSFISVSAHLHVPDCEKIF